MSGVYEFSKGHANFQDMLKFWAEIRPEGFIEIYQPVSFENDCRDRKGAYDLLNEIVIIGYILRYHVRHECSCSKPIEAMVLRKLVAITTIPHKS